MGYIKSFFYEFKNTYTIDDQLITIVFVSLFLPWILSAVVLIAAALYIFIKSNFKETIQRVPCSMILIIFSVYLLVISLLNSNWIGAGLSVGMFCLFSVVIHYRRYIHKELFEQLLDIAIVLSFVSIAYAIFEQFHYMSLIEGMGFLDIQNKPQFRVHTFFHNANYYAMMILFVECFCVYKFFIIKEMKWKMYYTVAGILNLFALFLTGGRVAWACLALGILVMVVLNKWYKTFITLIVAGVGAMGILALKPGLLPRLASQGLAIGRRTKIWHTAVLIIKDSALFGRGPLTYYNVYPDYVAPYQAIYGSKGWGKLGISSQHAHTMFLEPLVSFGIVGSILLLVYLFSQAKYIVFLLTKKINHTLGALLVGMCICTLSFCIIDFPIFWVQTAGLFLLVIGSTDIYKKEMHRVRVD